MDTKSIVLRIQSVNTSAIAYTRIISAAVASLSGSIAVLQSQAQVLGVLNPKIALYLTMASALAYSVSSMLAHVSDIETQVQKDLDAQDSVVGPQHTDLKDVDTKSK